MRNLIQFEESHRKIISTLYYRIHPQGEHISESITDALKGVLEGGLPIDKFLTENKPFVKDPGSLLQLAMMVEAQALDLYMRFAGKAERPDTRQMLYELASEERKHLTAVGRLFNQKLSERS